MYNFEPYNVLLSIATNIAELLMTVSVLQGHRYYITRQKVLNSKIFNVFLCFLKKSLLLTSLCLFVPNH